MSRPTFTTNPPLLRGSDLTGAVYIVTRYRHAGEQLVVANKVDCTQDFYRIAAERWPVLVELGLLTPKVP